MNSISIENVCIEYKAGQPVLENINLQLDSGKIYGLIGINGSGKTTFLKGIIDDVSLSKGEITINEHKNSNFEVNSKLIGCLIDNNLPENVTVVNFLEYLFKVKNVTYDSNVLKMFDLEKFKNKKIKSLSFGNKQRVLLTIALMFDQPIIILDEPLIGLDPIGIDKLKKELIKRKKNNNLIIFSNHQLEEMKGLCDEFYFVNNGMVSPYNFDNNEQFILETSKSTYVLNNSNLDEQLRTILECDSAVSITHKKTDVDWENV